MKKLKSWFDAYFYPFIAFTLFLYATFEILLNPSTGFVHSEVVAYSWNNALYNGFNLQIRDLLAAFDWLAFDGFDRLRFVSNLFQVLTIKLKFILPYDTPSLTLVAPLILFVGPYLLWKTFRTLLGAPAAGWISIALWFCSTGALAGLAMNWHPAKPLVVFFAVFVFYLFSILENRNFENKSKTHTDFFLITCLLVIFFLLPNTDEAGLIFLVCCPVLMPSLLFSRNWRTRLVLKTVGIAFLAFVFWSLITAPKIVSWAGYESIQYDHKALEYLRFNLKYDSPGTKLLKRFLWNIYFSIAQFVPFFDIVLNQFFSIFDLCHLKWMFNKFGSRLPFNPLTIPKWIAILYAIIGPLFVVGVSTVLYRKASKTAQQIVVLSLFFIVLLALGHAILLPACALYSIYYHGSLLSVPILIASTALLSPTSIKTHSRFEAFMRPLLLCIACFSMLTNFWAHHILWKGGTIPNEALIYFQNNKLNFESSKKIVSEVFPILRTFAKQLGLTKNFDVGVVYSKQELFGRNVWSSKHDKFKYKPLCKVCAFVSGPELKAIRLIGIPKDAQLPPIPKEWENVEIIRP